MQRNHVISSLSRGNVNLPSATPLMQAVIRSALLTRQWIFCLPVIQVGLIDGGINCATEGDGQIVDTET
jgi:hypothetical protein